MVWKTHLGNVGSNGGDEGVMAVSLSPLYGLFHSATLCGLGNCCSLSGLGVVVAIALVVWAE